MAEPLEEIAEYQAGDAPIPRQEEKGDHARDGQRNANEMNRKVSRILVSFAPVAPRLQRDAADESSDRKPAALRRRFWHHHKIATCAAQGKFATGGSLSSGHEPPIDWHLRK